MGDETVKTIIWAVLIAFAIHGFVLYTVIRLLVTGRSVFERRERPGDPARGRIIGMEP
jgi:hypothetical protein